MSSPATTGMVDVGTLARLFVLTPRRIQQLAAEGVQVCFQHIKTNTPKTIDLFRRLGYEEIDLILGKRLDKNAT